LVNKTSAKQTFIVETETESGELDSLGSTYLPILAVLPADQMKPGIKIKLSISMEGNEGRKGTRLVEAPFVGPSR
jgi:hypothetical protein